MYLAGPFKGAPLCAGRDHPGARRPLRLRRRRRPGRAPRRSADRPGDRGLRHGARRSSAASRSGCARSRSTSTSPNFTINPTNCAPFSVDSQGIGDQGTVTDFSSYFHAVNCATLPFKPKMTRPPARRRKDTKRSRNPQPAVRPPDPARRRQHQVARGDAAEGLRDRPAPPRQHLLEKRSSTAEQCAGRQTIGTVDDDDAAARPAAHRPGLRGLRLRQAAARSSSSSTARSRLIPQAESASVNGRPPEDGRPGRPRRPDRPLPPRPLRRQAGLPGQHQGPLRIARRRSRSTTSPRTARPCSQNGEDEDRLRQGQDEAQAPPALSAPSGLVVR